MMTLTDDDSVTLMMTLTLMAMTLIIITLTVYSDASGSDVIVVTRRMDSRVCR